MTSTSLGFSLINTNENIKEGFNNQNKNPIERKRYNRTIKAPRKPANEKVRNMMEKLHSNPDDNELGDFNPPPKPVSMANENRAERESYDNKDQAMTHEEFSAMTEGSYANQYYNQYVPAMNNQPQVNNTPVMSSASNELIEKLNYMIHLLEEQHDEKVNNITEEIVLYSFLGVFVIFIIDSFVKVGKYIR